MARARLKIEQLEEIATKLGVTVRAGGVVFAKPYDVALMLAHSLQARGVPVDISRKGA